MDEKTVDNIMARELERVRQEIARQKRTGKKRSTLWTEIDLDKREVSIPPGVLRVVNETPGPRPPKAPATRSRRFEQRQ
jgi:hypothetical protein